MKKLLSLVLTIVLLSAVVVIGTSSLTASASYDANYVETKTTNIEYITVDIAKKTKTDLFTGFETDFCVNPNTEGNGTAGDPYIIKTANQFAAVVTCQLKDASDNWIDTDGLYFKIADNIKGFNLKNTNCDVDFSKDTLTAKDVENALKNLEVPSDLKWENKSGKPFKGRFDGNGAQVYGLKGDAGYTAIFPKIGGNITVKNLTVKNCYFIGNNVSALFGANMNPGETSTFNTKHQLFNCQVYNNVIVCTYVDDEAIQKAGVLIGQTEWPTESKLDVNDCLVYGNIAKHIENDDNNPDNRNITYGMVGNLHRNQSFMVYNSILMDSAPHALYYGSNAHLTSISNNMYTNMMYKTATPWENVDYNSSGRMWRYVYKYTVDSGKVNVNFDIFNKDGVSVVNNGDGYNRTLPDSLVHVVDHNDIKGAKVLEGISPERWTYNKNGYPTPKIYKVREYSADKEPIVYRFNETNLTAIVIDCEQNTTTVTIPKKIINDGKIYAVIGIGNYAFQYCTSLTSITIPDSITSIGDNAFYNCSSLTSVTIPDSVTSIGSYAFYGCNSLEKITLPFVGQNADGTGFTNFGYIFGACDDSYPEYDNFKFVSSSLKEVVITGSNSIAEDAFYECKSLTSISFTGNVRVFGEWAFSYCTGLKKVTIPKTCKRISSWAFYDCVNLSDVYYCDSKSAKNNITIEHGNDPLDDADWYYNSCIGTKSHNYNNSCDKSCNVCGAIRTIKHTYTNSCDKTCDVCKATRNIYHTYSNACDKTCNVCKATRTVPAHKYTTITTKATLAKNGKVVKKCKVCGKVASTTTIKYVKSFKLSTTSYTYNGKVKTPSVTVKDSAGKTLKKNTDYTVSYASGRKNVGTYKVTIKMKGKYSGTKTLTFKINPVKTSVSKLTAGKKSITVNISKKSTQVSGYQVQYSTSKKFTSAKTKTISSYKTTKYTLKSLSAKKTYYVRVRTYKTVSGKKYYSGWSTYKYVKTK